MISLTSSSITPTLVDFLRSRGLGVVMIFIEVIIAFFVRFWKCARLASICDLDRRSRGWGIVKMKK